MKKQTEKAQPKCSACGFRIRGKNHEQGGHHKRGFKGTHTPPRH